MAGVEEQNRRRVAAILGLIGVGLVLIGLALIVHHEQCIETTSPPAQRIPSDRIVPLAQVIQQVLFWLLVLVGILAISSFAFLRWSRHFRRRLFHQPAPPSPAEDVWAMHRPPEEPAKSEPTTEWGEDQEPYNPNGD